MQFRLVRARWRDEGVPDVEGDGGFLEENHSEVGNEPFDSGIQPGNGKVNFIGYFRRFFVNRGFGNKHGIEIARGLAGVEGKYYGDSP